MTGRVVGSDLLPLRCPPAPEVWPAGGRGGSCVFALADGEGTALQASSPAPTLSCILDLRRLNPSVRPMLQHQLLTHLSDPKAGPAAPRSPRKPAALRTPVPGPRAQQESVGAGRRHSPTLPSALGRDCDPHPYSLGESPFSGALQPSYVSQIRESAGE